MDALIVDYRRVASSIGDGSAVRSLPFVLSIVAGSVDTIGFFGLNGLFTAHVTGNLVVLAAHVVAGSKASLALIISVPVFIAAIALTRLLAAGFERVGIARPSIAGFVLGCTLGAACEAAFGIDSLALPIGLALVVLMLSLIAHARLLPSRALRPRSDSLATHPATLREHSAFCCCSCNAPPRR